MFRCRLLLLPHFLACWTFDCSSVTNERERSVRLLLHLPLFQARCDSLPQLSHQLHFSQFVNTSLLSARSYSLSSLPSLCALDSLSAVSVTIIQISLFLVAYSTWPLFQISLIRPRPTFSQRRAFMTAGVNWWGLSLHFCCIIWDVRVQTLSTRHRSLMLCYDSCYTCCVSHFS